MSSKFGKKTTSSGIFTAINKNYFNLRDVLSIPKSFNRNQNIPTKESSSNDISYHHSDSDSEPDDNLANKTEVLETFFSKQQWDEINLRKHFDGKRNRTMPSKGWADIVNAAVFQLFKLTCKFNYQFKNSKTLGVGLCKECGNSCKVEIVEQEPVSDIKFKKIEVSVIYGKNFAQHTRKRFIRGNDHLNSNYYT